MRKEKIIQFGEGGFLRGFVDWMVQYINENTDFNGSAVVVQPIENGMCDMLTAQNCEYTHICRGAEGFEEKKIDVGQLGVAIIFTGIAIPYLFTCMNSKILNKNYDPADYVKYTTGKGKASDCIKCGKCEIECPQKLPIRELLEKVAKSFER